MLLKDTICAALLSFQLLRGVLAHRQSHDLPDLIDLGYAKHVPTWTNVTSTGTELLNYNNIRFAKPPTGSRRFRKPQVPPPRSKAVQNGNVTSWETDCLSSAPIGVPFPLLNGSTVSALLKAIMYPVSKALLTRKISGAPKTVSS
jgi:hypothetical protein